MVRISSLWYIIAANNWLVTQSVSLSDRYTVRQSISCCGLLFCLVSAFCSRHRPSHYITSTTWALLRGISCLATQSDINPLIIAPHPIIWSSFTGRWWVGCYIWYSEEGTGRSRSPPRPILAVPNVTAHPSTISVPITVLLYNGPLLCSINVPVKGLRRGTAFYLYPLKG